MKGLMYIDGPFHVESWGKYVSHRLAGFQADSRATDWYISNIMNTLYLGKRAIATYKIRIKEEIDAQWCTLQFQRDNRNVFYNSITFSGAEANRHRNFITYCRSDQITYTDLLLNADDTNRTRGKGFMYISFFVEIQCLAVAGTSVPVFRNTMPGGLLNVWCLRVTYLHSLDQGYIHFLKYVIR
jgi:hypothetical protein